MMYECLKRYDSSFILYLSFERKYYCEKSLPENVINSVRDYEILLNFITKCITYSKNLLFLMRRFVIIYSYYCLPTVSSNLRSYETV